jgi:hypothetical protein
MAQVAAAEGLFYWWFNHGMTDGVSAPGAVKNPETRTTANRNGIGVNLEIYFFPTTQKSPLNWPVKHQCGSVHGHHYFEGLRANLEKYAHPQFTRNCYCGRQIFGGASIKWPGNFHVKTAG